MKPNVTFHSSWFLVAYALGTFLIVIVFGILDRGFFSYSASDWLFALACIMGVIVLLALSTLRTYIALVEGEVLINSGHRTFGQDRVAIQSIKRIARVQAFVWKSWGSLMVIYFIDDNGEPAATYVREDNYSEDTLKAILKELTRINSSIELDEQYNKFLVGNLPSWPYFKNLPAARMVKDTDAEMKERFGRKA